MRCSEASLSSFVLCSVALTSGEKNTFWPFKQIKKNCANNLLHPSGNFAPARSPSAAVVNHAAQRTSGQQISGGKKKKK